MHTHHSHELPESIEATGRGVVRRRPDRAIIRLGVVVTAERPDDANVTNATRMTAVLHAIRTLGVPESAIQTVGLSLQPVYEWDEGAKQSLLVGYRASNGIEVQASVQEAGAIYDAGVGAGANEAGGITLTLKEDVEARREALILATQRALDEIAIVAGALDVGLRGPLRVEILEEGGIQPFEVALKAADASTPVSPGQVSVSGAVRLVCALQGK
ncbi:MAG: SIMPL domain-containing protein [Nannocystaceae bacterium]